MEIFVGKSMPELALDSEPINALRGLNFCLGFPALGACALLEANMLILWPCSCFCPEMKFFVDKSWPKLALESLPINAIGVLTSGLEFLTFEVGALCEAKMLILWPCSCF